MVIQDEAKQRAISVLTPMSLLANKMKHGNLCVLSRLLIRSNDPPIDQEPLPHANPAGKPTPCSPSPPKIYISCFCATQKIPRPSRLPGNTITKACMQPHHEPLANTRNARMEIIDREREKAWLEQMDTILIFVCLISFDIRLS